MVTESFRVHTWRLLLLRWLTVLNLLASSRSLEIFSVVTQLCFDIVFWVVLDLFLLTLIHFYSPWALGSLERLFIKLQQSVLIGVTRLGWSTSLKILVIIVEFSQCTRDHIVWIPCTFVIGLSPSLRITSSIHSWTILFQFSVKAVVFHDDICCMTHLNVSNGEPSRFCQCS